MSAQAASGLSIGISDFAHVCTDAVGWPSPLSDNFPLSDTPVNRLAGLSQDALDPAVAEYLLAARAANTHRAYAADLADFEAWGGSIPSTPDQIARYIAHRASALRPSTLRRRLAALASIHRDRGLSDPTKHTLVRRVVQGIERKHGTSVRQVAPLLIEDLARIVGTLGGTLADQRDRAVLLVGFFGALRRSEIASLEVSSLSATASGATLTIARSKTDQAARGRTVHLTARNDPLCPVSALAAWLAASGITEGALFRQIRGGCGGDLGPRLYTKVIARLVKHRVAQIDLDPDRYSGHSLRAGFVTSAALSGADGTLIAQQTGHRSLQTLAAYVRPESALNLHHVANAPEILRDRAGFGGIIGPWPVGMTGTSLLKGRPLSV